MTGQSGGTQDPQHENRSASYSSLDSISSHEGPSLRRRRRSASLERRLSNVVDVEDASRLIECSQIERQLRFQRLVRRYISQILYGCHNVYCTTPTCLSCNRRLVSKPFRAPTQLTARALAHFLASQDNPENGLCPNQLKVAPDSLEVKGATGVEVWQKEKGAGRFCSFFPTARQSAYPLVAPRCDPLTEKLRFILFSLPDTHGQNDTREVLAAIEKRHQVKKDLKSLGQNLFDTVSVIYSYSKQIPSPSSVLASLRSPLSEERVLTMASTSQKELDDSRSTTPMMRANGHVLLPVNGARSAPETSTHHSHRELKSTSQSALSRITSEVLSNGERIHKVRHHLPEVMGNGHPITKSQKPLSLDGGLETATPMKNVPRTLDGYFSLKVDIERPLSVRAKHTEHSGKGNEAMPILPVARHLDCDIMDQLKEEVYRHHHNEQGTSINFIDYDAHRRFRPTKPFVNRSLFFTLGDPETLLRSFHDDGSKTFKDSPLPHLNSTRLAHSFRDWNRRNGALIFDSLWIAVEALFRLPPELESQKSPRLKPSRKSSTPSEDFDRNDPRASFMAVHGRFLNDLEVAHIIMVCIHALTSLIPVGWPHVWVQLRKFRSWGVILPNSMPHKGPSDGFADPWLPIVDELEYEPAIRLADRLLRGIGARLCFERILATLGRRGDQSAETSPLLELLIGHLVETERLALLNKSKVNISLDYQEDPGWTVTATFMEWLRTVIIKKWDGKPEVNRWNSVGTAITLLDKFHQNQQTLNLRSNMFHMPYLQERIDEVSESVAFLNWEYHPNSLHVFEYPCLFPPKYLLGYFRTINFTTMFKQYEHTERAAHLQRALDPFLKEPYWHMIRNRLRVTQSDYLVLDVRREHPLEDTLNQLWGQERRLFLKPLKVKMGMQEGEVGLDQGGVTYEFFRVVLEEAFQPNNGMFTIDPQTRMTWFQPASLEPDWRFEILGILFSLAIYNGITLPVTFPTAFYHGLLNLHEFPTSAYPNTTNFIRDGWPTLAKSLDELLTWKDGDVADIFMRTYNFSFEAFGRRFNVDMQAFDSAEEPIPWPVSNEKNSKTLACGPFGIKWPTNKQRPDLNSGAWESPSRQTVQGSSSGATDTINEAPLVTNANREKFVSDYIFWLTYRSIAPQFMAFRNGFYSCLHPKSLSLFDPQSLKALVEGTQEIDLAALKNATRYEEGYSDTHNTIKNFWSIVDTYGPEDKRRLLEFVTASERVPITGFESMNFIIVRTEPDNDRLPTSSTCFGKLMLPEYPDKETMKRKLDLALQNSKGFGVV